jgi:hypothetical protein
MVCKRSAAMYLDRNVGTGETAVRSEELKTENLYYEENIYKTVYPAKCRNIIGSGM